MYFVAFNFHMPAETSHVARHHRRDGIGGVFLGPLQPVRITVDRTCMTISLHGAAGECGKIAYVYRKVQDR